MRHDGFHGRSGFGERPAVLVVDLSVGFTDPASPLVCDLDGVVAAVARILAAARAAGRPVIYTTVVYDAAGERAASIFIEKVPALLTLAPGSRFVEIDRRLAPAPGEPGVQKYFASAFHGTALPSLLAAEGCDSVIVTGASTSGCVRATAVDALQHGYRTVVPRDAVGDRNPAAHDANLYDIDTKYGDVVSTDEVVEHLETLAPVGARS
jgi:maleamate amidohydrolase